MSMPATPIIARVKPTAAATTATEAVTLTAGELAAVEAEALDHYINRRPMKLAACFNWYEGHNTLPVVSRQTFEADK
jgi:hypothetical protein